MNLTALTLEKQLNNEFPSLLQPQSEFCSLYEISDDTIGRGRYAIVRLCKNRQNGMTFAGKFIKKRRRNEIVKELRVLRFSHLSPHVVSLIEVHELNSDLIILLEHARGGDLQTLLEECVHVSEDEGRRIITELLNALSFLHGMHIIHLDVKPQNILLLNDWPDTTVRLCDFGLSRSENDDMPQEIAGTADYIAPEVIAYDQLTVACDMWSTGVVTYVLLSGLCPFQGDCNQEVFVSITRGSFDFPEEEFARISDSAKNFIKWTLQLRPKLRPSAENALKHDWLAPANGTETPNDFEGDDANHTSRVAKPGDQPSLSNGNSPVFQR